MHGAMIKILFPDLCAYAYMGSIGVYKHLLNHKLVHTFLTSVSHMDNTEKIWTQWFQHENRIWCPMTENNLWGRRMNAILLEYGISKMYTGEMTCMCIYVCYEFL